MRANPPLPLPPGTGGCGKFESSKLTRLILAQLGLLSVGILATGKTLDTAATQPWTLIAVLFLVTLFCLSQVCLWFQLRVVYVDWDRA